MGAKFSKKKVNDTSDQQVDASATAGASLGERFRSKFSKKEVKDQQVNASATESASLGQRFRAKFSKNNVNDSSTKEVDVEAQQAAAASTTAANASFGQRFRSEVRPCQKYFDANESNGQILDIPKSFARPGCLMFIGKLAVAALALYTLVLGVQGQQGNRQAFYMAYISNWGVIFSVIYTILSFFNSTLFASRTSQPDNNAVGCRIRLTWMSYTLAWALGLASTILFWALLYNKQDYPKLNYIDVVPHGVLVVLVLWMGTFCDRIPVRLYHYYVTVMPVTLLLAVWFYIHSLTDIGNPNQDDTDAVYANVLEWKESWKTPLVYTVLIVSALFPLVYLVVWVLMGCISKRYKSTSSAEVVVVDDTADQRQIQKNTSDDVLDDTIDNLTSILPICWCM